MRLLLFLSFSLSVLMASAQDYLAKTIRHSFDSKPFAKERTIDIFIPDGYTQSTTEKAMILYVFDGQFAEFFAMTCATANYLYAIGEFPLFIAVAIHTENRPREFTPAPYHMETPEGWGEESDVGNSALLDRHLMNEVMPYIKGNYRTMQINLAVGHSLGGTYVTNDVLTNNIFKGVISISPNTQYDRNHLIAKMDTLLSNGVPPKAFHYMTAGTIGNMENSFRNASDLLDSTYRAHPSVNLKWHYKIYQNQNHSSTPMRSIGEGLMAFNKVLEFNDSTALSYLGDSSKPYVEHVVDHYDKLSEWLGYTFVPSADVLNSLGYVAMGEKKYSEALAVFAMARSKHPDNANLYDSTGEAWENLKNYEKAFEYYNEALSMIESQQGEMQEEVYNFYLDLFRENVGRTNELIEKE